MKHKRTAERADDAKVDLSVRLNKIEGQIRGIAKMIEQDVYCDQVLHQVASVQAALNSVSKLILEDHIKTCVVDRIQAGETEVVGELLATIKTILK